MNAKRTCRPRFPDSWAVRLLFAGLLLEMSARVLCAATLPASARAGQALFREKCKGCHSIGQGDLVGPDLKGVTIRRDPNWLTRWISAPDQMLARKDPIALDLLQRYHHVPMPNLGLRHDQVSAVIAYLRTFSEGSAASPPPGGAVATPLRGDPARGEKLFTGVLRLQNGGPPCMACHSIAGMRTLGGGALGPDLTPAAQKYGVAGILSILANIPFPTMSPIFTVHPLTPEEQGDLAAFLKAAPVTERPVHAVMTLFGLAVGYAVVIFAVIHGVWSRRLSGVRRSLVRRHG